MLKGNATLTLRSRLRCIIVQKHADRKESTISPATITDGNEPPVEISPTSKPAANILVSQEKLLTKLITNIPLLSMCRF